MKRMSTQIVTSKLNLFLEKNAYNKAEIARRAEIKPDDFYLMLGNQKIMIADDFVRICSVLNKNPSEILGIQ